MAYLFDTDAISEVLRPRPSASYLRWLGKLPRSEQFTSALTVGELYREAFRSTQRARHVEHIQTRVLPALSVLPYDVDAARLFGAIQAELEHQGRGMPDADLQVAAIAIQHGLELVTGNLRQFRHVPGLRLNTSLADSRGA